MANPLEYSVSDWLSLHQLAASDAYNYCNMISDKYQGGVNKPSIDYTSSGITLVLSQTVEHLVLPSLQALLNLSNTQYEALSQVKVIQYHQGELALPYTEYTKEDGNDDSSEDKKPTIHLVWSGTADDVMCLAHEMAHAAQMILSGTAFMPPVARETCAFIGELALIHFTQNQSNALYLTLCGVWNCENKYYLGDDNLALANVLKVGALKPNRSAYIYRHNYPLARVAAMSLFATASQKATKVFFASGSAAMDHLNFKNFFAQLKQCPTAQPSQSIQDTTLHLSLPPEALTLVLTNQIDQSWQSQTASAACVSEANLFKGVEGLTPVTWAKWRALGVFALAALRYGEADMLPGEFIATHKKAAWQPPEQTFSFLTPWIRSKGFDALTALGMAIAQLATSSYHQQFKLSHYLPVEILPPLCINQTRSYVTQAGEPSAMVTWAWLSQDVEQQIHKTGCSLEDGEWASGHLLFFNDWISPYSNMRKVYLDMKRNIFPHVTNASSLRRKINGGVRKINHWNVFSRQKQTNPFTTARE